MSELKAGNTVRLKSGGPLMTISWIDNESAMARCEWFDKNNSFSSNDFYLDSLMLDDNNVKISFGTI
jgi:uncharacterized protein YodC (DUF2158 family)